jgi:hypothetical protein
MDSGSAFDVHPALDLLGGLVDRCRAFWLMLGRLESSALARELQGIVLTMPVFVCGLARSGSTLLHEIVAAHPGVATHRSKDYPLVFLPCWWRRATAGRSPIAPRERAHRDGVMVTPDSPDSLEEMLWLAFFSTCHDSNRSSLLGANDCHPEFEAFYRAHLRKILLAERASRYVAKANYHVARLPYLLRLFPDARFILPVRSPRTHVVSLMRQQEWFSAAQRKHPRARALMRRSGHFEFGLDRRPQNLGDPIRVQRILDLWARGDEVRGWACTWDAVYGYLDRLLQADSRVREAAKIVRFETLCQTPAETIREVLDHCRLPDTASADRFANAIRLPNYYADPLTEADLAIIHEETAVTASRWGY